MIEQDSLYSQIVTLTDVQLLSAILPNHASDSTSQSLLNQFGDIAGILGADYLQLQAVRGIGHKHTKKLLCIQELLKRGLMGRIRSSTGFSQVDHVRNFLKIAIAQKPYEVFVCLFLDSQNRLIHYEEIFRGSITQSAVYPREVAKTAILQNAVNVICAHNHPSGSPEPSESDIHITKLLKDALAILDIRLLDHFIVTAHTVVSLAEKRLC